MAVFKDINACFDWKRVTVTDDDWKKEDKRSLSMMLLCLFIIRIFEENVLHLKHAGLIHGPVHSSIGQEAVAVGTVSALSATDLISGTHRAHHQYLAKTLFFHAPEGFDPLADELTANMQQAVTELFAEIMGLAAGCCGGRGGSMHLCNPEAGILGTDAIVAGGIPVATGAAFAQQYRKSGRIVVSFFGDGAVNQGAFHEALNLAGLWKLPIIYLLENNIYAVATHAHKAAPLKELSLRASSYGMKGYVVDGMDPIAVKAAVETAVKDIRSGGAPCFIEAMTYRFLHHSGDVPGSSFGYRKKEEEDGWKQRDPLDVFPKRMIELGVITKEEKARLEKTVREVVKQAVDFCTEKPESSTGMQVRQSLWPLPESLATGLRSDGNEFAGVTYCDEETAAPAKTIKYVDAIAGVIGRRLETDPDVFVIGEEVGHFGGGAYQATRGLPQKYPNRVIDTPISEAGFSGLSCGAALCGLKPIVEIMFPDFVLVAADQIFNHIGKLRYMYGGKREIPLVMRTRIAVGCGYGGQHSMDPVALFALFPWWRIVAPATPFDYIGLFNSAMRSNDPVLIVEHHELYNMTGPVPEGNYDYFVRMGKAKKRMEGEDITVLSYSSTVALSVQAAKELASEGISVEILDLRTLDLAHIDYAAIGESLRKTSRLLIVEQAPYSNSIGGLITAECTRRFFDYFDCPAGRIAGADVPNPVSKVLESAAVPGVPSVKEKIRSMVSGDTL